MERTQIKVVMPDGLPEFRLPKLVQGRLQELLDRQDAGRGLSAIEAREAEALVDAADLLALLRLRTEQKGE